MKFITFFHMIRDAVIFAEKLKVRSISCRIKLNNIIEIEDLVYDFLLIIEEDKYFKAVFTEEIPEDFKKEYIFSFYSEKNTENLISDISSILDFKSGRENIAVIPAEPEEYYNLIGGYIKDNTLYNYNEELRCRYLIGELKNAFTNNVIHFSLNDLCRGSEDILLKIKKSPEEIQVFDGNSNNDIKIIAEAIKNSSIPYYIISGSSFLTCLYYLYNKSFIEKENSEGLDKMLILSSSKSLNYIDKLNDFIKSSKAEFYNLNIYSLIINPEEEQRRAYNYLVYNNKTKFIGVTTAASKEDIVNLEDFSSAMNIEMDLLDKKIHLSLAQASKRLLDSDLNIGCILCSSYKTALALLKELDVCRIEYCSEINKSYHIIKCQYFNENKYLLVKYCKLSKEIPLQEVYKKFKECY